MGGGVRRHRFGSYGLRLESSARDIAEEGCACGRKERPSPIWTRTNYVESQIRDAVTTAREQSRL